MSMATWIFCDSGSRSGKENMRLDEWLAEYWFTETRRPVFRLYGWSPFALSLGYHQSTGEIDVSNLTSAGYDLVRRPTGGRAVFHAEEITYSVIMDATGKSVDDVYESVSRVLASGLRAAGYDVAFAGGKQNFSKLYREKSSVSCFTASSEFEIQLAGRKLVGSAQRRYSRRDGGVTALQHGSILTGPIHHKLVDFLNIDETLKKKLKNSIRQSSTDLSEMSALPVDYTGLKNHLKDAAMQHLAGGNFDELDHAYFISRMKAEALSTEQIL